GNISGLTSQLGLGGLELATSLRQSVLGLAPASAQAALQRGAAEASQIMAFGGLGDSLLGAGAGFFAGPSLGLSQLGGSLIGASGGTGGLANFMLASALFGGSRLSNN